MRSITYAEAVREALHFNLSKDPNVVLFGPDVGLSGGSFHEMIGLLEEFGPSRIVDSPVSEAGYAGLAVGAAMYGMRPIACFTVVDFVTLCLEEVGFASKIRYMSGEQFSVPVIFRAGFTLHGRNAKLGTYGLGAQHSELLQAWFCNIPGLTVVVPSSPYDAKGLLNTAIEHENPVIFLERSSLFPSVGEVPDNHYTIKFGEASVRRTGSDVTVVATSTFVTEALKAADIVGEDGISVEVIDPRTFVPLDEATILGSIEKTGRLLVADEGYEMGGFGNQIVSLAARKQFKRLKAIQMLAEPNIPTPFSPSLLDAFIIDARQIADAIRRAAAS